MSAEGDEAAQEVNEEVDAEPPIDAPEEGMAAIADDAAAAGEEPAAADEPAAAAEGGGGGEEEALQEELPLTADEDAAAVVEAAAEPAAASEEEIVDEAVSEEIAAPAASPDGGASAAAAAAPSLAPAPSVAIAAAAPISAPTAAAISPPKPRPPKKPPVGSKKPPPAAASSTGAAAGASPMLSEEERAAKRQAAERREAAFRAAQRKEAAEKAAARAAAEAEAERAERALGHTFVGKSIPAWQRRVAHERAQANKAEAAVIAAQKERMQQAAARLARLKARAQREKARGGVAHAMIRVAEEKQQQHRAMVEQSERLTGRDVINRMRDEPTPDDEEVLRLSKVFNRALYEHFRPAERTFYRLFKLMDLDGSTRISFNELEALARGPLRLTVTQLPGTTLAALWKALDQNESGFIDAGELSRFMRRGQMKTLTPAQAARARMLARKEREAAAVQANSDALQEKGVVERAAAVEKASAEEVRTLGDICARKLATEGPYGVVNAISLFKLGDRDGSGLIVFGEFKRLVRVELHLDEEAIPEVKLLGLWRAIDENENGFITAGEFQRFMRGSLASDAKLSEIEGRRIERARERGIIAIQRSGDYSNAMAREAAEKAKEMEEEAARLEAQMGMTSSALKSRAAAPPPDLPLSKYEPRRMIKSKSMPVQLVLPPSHSPPKDEAAVHQGVIDGAAAEAFKVTRGRVQTPNTRLVVEALQGLARDVVVVAPDPKPRRTRVGALEASKKQAMAAYTGSLPSLHGAARRQVA